MSSFGLPPYTDASAREDAAAVAGTANVRIVRIFANGGAFFRVDSSARDVAADAARTCADIEVDSDTTRRAVFKRFDAVTWLKHKVVAADTHAADVPLSALAGTVVYLAYCPQ